MGPGGSDRLPFARRACVGARRSTPSPSFCWSTAEDPMLYFSTGKKWQPEVGRSSSHSDAPGTG
jgi:hypothetical protein